MRSKIPARRSRDRNAGGAQPWASTSHSTPRGTGVTLRPADGASELHLRDLAVLEDHGEVGVGPASLVAEDHLSLGAAKEAAHLLEAHAGLDLEEVRGLFGGQIGRAHV